MSDISVLGIFVADISFSGPKIPAIGETILGNKYNVGPGGKGCNQAVAIARLGAKVNFISKIGKDSYGKLALNTLTKNKINFYRGSNLDVLGRFFGAANLQKTDLIIRICSDNPFIDATEVDYLIRKFKSKKYDYSCNHQNRLNSNYVDGFGAEIFTYDLLKKLNFIVKKKSDREHVTKYVWDNIKKFKILQNDNR